MIALFALFYVIMFIYGILLIFAKDVAWSFVKWSNSIRGLMSDRTQQWETYSSIQGGLVVVVSGIFLCRLISSSSPPSSESRLLTSNQSSFQSAAMVASLPHPVALDLSSPNSAFHISAQSNSNGVDVSWTIFPGVLLFHVNRSQNRTGPYYELPDYAYYEHEVAHHIDHTASIGMTYFYIVSATTTSGDLVSNSQVVKITQQPVKASMENRL